MRRLVLLALVLPLVAGCGTAGPPVVQQPRFGPTLQGVLPRPLSCGFVDVGHGWHVQVTPPTSTPTCHTAMRMIRAYLRSRLHGRLRDKTLMGYTCYRPERRDSEFTCIRESPFGRVDAIPPALLGH